MPPRWRKVWRDLWINRIRTLLVILSIAVGVFTIGMVASTRVLLSRDLNASYLATSPASAILFLSDPFDTKLVEVVRRVDGVIDAEGRRNITLRLQIGPDEWRALRLDVIYDFDNMRLDQIRPQEGAWPPPEQCMLVERASIGLTNAQVGDQVLVELPDGTQHILCIAGLAHDMNKQPAAFVGQTYGYITFDTLEWLGYPRTFNELHLLIDRESQAEIKEVAAEVQEKVEKGNYRVFWSWVPEPGKHPADEIVQPMLLVLGIIGSLTLLLSGFLVVNTISAVLSQQVRQIGVMKTLGARSGQMMQMYLGMVFVFALLSLFIGVPLGAVAAYAFTSYLASLINFDLAGFSIPIEALLLEIAAGMVVPLLAALWPVASGTRVTVREALSDYGLGRGCYGSNWLDQWLMTILGLPRPLLLSLRNTFRRKGRLALTLLTLTLAGGIFISVFSVRASLLLTLDEIAAYWKYDVYVIFGRSYRTEQIAREALQVPGIVSAESWTDSSALRLHADGTEGPTFGIIAPPPESVMIQPVVVEGRWLLPSDENAIVLDTDVLSADVPVEVGETITLKMQGREGEWLVVGIVKPTMTGSVVRFGTGYVNFPYFAELTRQVGRAASVRVITTDHDAPSQTQAALRLEEHFTRAGLDVRSTRTTSDIRESILFQFNVLVAFLSTMAVLLAVVGALGLTGTMSINVLERAREIGVMRAIGASDRAVLQIFMTEGMLIGIISWPLGLLLAFPISRLLSDQIGNDFIGSPLTYTFSMQGAFFWLVVVLSLSALASFVPAWNAARLTVREVLAYE
ncbi:MAG: FtsX-like permease family protein [Ardenticatenales bacterium]|nr:FtsX-like permease family protein [Ardenticatenales bacterium]